VNAPAESFIAALDAVASSADAGEARRAALLLHTVSTDDRAWLLSRLEVSDRVRLQGLVDELRAIGIPPAPELLEELGPTVAAGVHGGDAVASSGLRHADPFALASLFAAEPAELIARVIAQGPWPWTGALLARMGASQRQQVLDRVTSLSAAAGRAPSVLDARLLALVEARLAQHHAETMSARPVAAAADARKSGGWLRRWLSSSRVAGAANRESRA
jgi:hypothetical protein